MITFYLRAENLDSVGDLLQDQEKGPDEQKSAENFDAGGYRSKCLEQSLIRLYDL